MIDFWIRRTRMAIVEVVIMKAQGKIVMNRLVGRQSRYFCPFVSGYFSREFGGRGKWVITACHRCSLTSIRPTLYNISIEVWRAGNLASSTGISAVVAR